MNDYGGTAEEHMCMRVQRERRGGKEEKREEKKYHDPANPGSQHATCAYTPRGKRIRIRISKSKFGGARMRVQILRPRTPKPWLLMLTEIPIPKTLLSRRSRLRVISRGSWNQPRISFRLSISQRLILFIYYNFSCKHNF